MDTDTLPPPGGDEAPALPTLLNPATEKPTGSSDPPSNIPAVLMMVIGFSVAFIAIFGFTLFFTTFLWLVVGASVLGAAVFVIAAVSADTKDSDKQGAWMMVALCIGVGFVAWLVIPVPVTAKDRAQLTLDYWNALPLAMSEMRTQQPNTSEEKIVLLRSVAQQINRLPTANVDEDAIQIGLALHAWLEFIATNVEHQNSADPLITAFVKGLQGDLFGPYLDAVQSNNDVQRQSDELMRKLRTTRALLSSRYGVEFPHLD